MSEESITKMWLRLRSINPYRYCPFHIGDRRTIFHDIPVIYGMVQNIFRVQELCYFTGSYFSKSIVSISDTTNVQREYDQGYKVNQG